MTMTATNSFGQLQQCGHCGMYHTDTVCPKIKSIEYFDNGRVKKVEYKDESISPMETWKLA